jgi:tetratricopeptide (TPR) repeat protein
MKKKIIIIFLLITNQNGYSQTILNDIRQHLSSTVTIILDDNSKSGSGFIIGDGKIITNLHVIEGSINGYVVVNGTDLRHRIDGYFNYDNRTDLAILSVPSLKGVPLTLADDPQKNGEKVFAFENPIISDKVILEGNIEYSIGTSISGVIKTSIPLKFGNSGGAIVNTKGQVIGIVFGATITEEEGLMGGYAIDVSFLKNLLKNKNETKKNLNLIKGGYYYLNQFRLKYDVKDYSGALTDINKSIELNPESFSSYYNRANLNLKLNNLQGCIDDCSKSIEIIPNFALAFYMRGIAKMKLKKINDAIEDFDKSIEIDANFASAYNIRGMAKGELNNLNGAIIDLDKSIEIEPRNSLFFLIRGGFKYFSTNKKEGCQDLQKAKELGHKDAQTLLDKFCD